MPFFSIIIPCYNQSEWLTFSLSELQKQDFQQWEAIVVNDGSTDDSGTVADNFASTDSRIKVIHQNNLGLSSARNTGIRNASGKWLNFHDSDDYLLPGCLNKLHQTIHAHPDFELFQTGHELVDESNQIIRSGWLLEKEGLFLKNVFKGNPGPPLSFFISSKTAIEAGDFDPSLKSAEDWDFWIRVAKMGVPRFTVREPWVAYRYNSMSMTRNPWRMYENTVKVIERIPSFDQRIQRKSIFNEDLEYDVKEAVKIRLIQCLGLTIMQGDIDLALEKFRKESRDYQFLFEPHEFRHMNSFMTFKNWYRKKDVEDILTKFPPLFNQFFKQTYFSESFQHTCMLYVFEFHKKNQNLYRWGFWGKWKNRQLDNKLKQIRFQAEKGC